MEMIQSLVDSFLLLTLLTALAVSPVISEIAAQVPLAPRLAAPEEFQELIYSPWTKICTKGQDAKTVCLTGRDGRLRNGISAVNAVLIEQEERPNKILRITLPLGISIGPGTRVIVDRGEPMSGPYVICFANGCAADYDVTADFIGRLKNGRNLVVQGIRRRSADQRGAVALRFRQGLRGTADRPQKTVAGRHTTAALAS